MTPKLKRRKLNVSIMKQQSSDYELIASAYHEAAHTIVALANLVLVDKVSITVDMGGDTFYSCYHADNTESEILKKLIVIAEIKTIYAGLVGEKMYYRDISGNTKLPMHLRIGSSSDNKVGSNLIRKYKLAKSGKETVLLKRHIKDEAEKFLLKHWSAVKAVAHSLYKKKKLNTAELKYILIRNIDDKDFWKEIFKKIKILYEQKKDLSEKTLRSLISSKFIR